MSAFSPRARNACRGFTLIELLVVIVIVAILFSYTTLAIRGHDPEEMIQTEARRLDRLIQLALEEAILRGEEYALEVGIDGYRFLRFQQQRWVVIDTDRILRTRQLPVDMELELSLEETEIVIDPNAGMSKEFSLESEVDKFAEEGEDGNKRKKLEPQIYLLSSGEITPEFSIRLFYPGVETSYLVEGRFDGEHNAVISEL
ncbi:MAG TPA: type II secretion system protein GspH [Thiotrichales bacterium]|nr:type II secretion system protein GspH [Thiotrichales bacterium]